MRIFLLLACASCIASPATAETRNFGVSGFDRIKIQGPFRVKIVTGVPPSAKAIGTGAALSNIDVNVEGYTLTLSPNASAWANYSGSKEGPVEVVIGTHELAAAMLTGAGTMAIDKVKGFEFVLTVNGAGSASVGEMAVDRLTLGVAGTGALIVAGKAKQLTAEMRGTTSIDASALSAKDATVKVNGGGTARLNVTGTANVSGAGAGLVEFLGSPSCTLTVEGAGAVSGCR